MKKLVISLLTLSAISIILANPVSALTEQSNIDVSFKFNDTLTVSLSSPNLVISDLAPGTVSDSNIITVNVLSNNPYGYTLNSTVGSSTSPYSTYGRNLVHTTSSSSTTPFSSLDYGTSIPDLSDSTVDPNTWGYSFSLNDGTTWSNYSGLPLYTDTEHISTLKESTTTSAASGDNIEFKIAAKAASTQLAGEYQNIINFIATGTPTPAFCDTHTCMQDLTLASCQVNVGQNGNPAGVGDNITVYDKRDESDYTVRYINGGCWMTQNLRITGTISAADSNFTGNDFNISEYSLDANDPSYTNHCDSTNSYDYACAKDSGNISTGVWYNFVSASAGTITTDSNTDPATEDICPAGWHLPSGPPRDTSTEFYKLYNDTVNTRGSNDYLNAFGIAIGGVYGDGLISNTEYGYYWANTPGTTELNRWILYYNSSNNTFYGAGGYNRYRGIYIRCIHAE